MLLECIFAATHRPLAETEYLTCRILQHQFGLVSDEGILRNSTGLRTVQRHDIVLYAYDTIDG